MPTPRDSTPAPHSAEYFGETRDHWWNPDFLALMATRLNFHAITTILDIGCGVGHWGRALLPHLPATSTLTGIDPEPQWIEQARAIAAARGLSSRTTYTQSRVEHLPFADNSFDLVTCQTVLIHLADVPAALSEMIRVLRPGGLLLAVEPNNLAASLVSDSTRFQESLETRLALVRFQATCERGKEILGEGNNSIGDLIPGLIAAAGMRDIRVHLSDRATPLIPPYVTPRESAIIAETGDRAARNFWIWSEQDTRRYFLAGGGQESDFAPLWCIALATNRAESAAIAAGTHHTAGGMVLYLASGRKA